MIDEPEVARSAHVAALNDGYDPRPGAVNYVGGPEFLRAPVAKPAGAANAKPHGLEEVEDNRSPLQREIDGHLAAMNRASPHPVDIAHAVRFLLTGAREHA